MEEKIGDKSTCQQCGAEIVFVGPYWDHRGEIKPKHIAIPVAPAQPEAAPLQPWWKDLDARETAQLLHARAYARQYASAGAPGHGQFLLLAKLSEMLDAQISVVKVRFDEQTQSWYDVVTGVKVNVS